MTSTIAKKERINLRLDQRAKDLIERAAGLEGRTVSAFILSSALTSAGRTIREHETMRLDEQDALHFFDALARPVVLDGELGEALAEHDRRVDSR